MKIIMFLGTAAALSLGVGSAYAGNEGASAKPIPNVVAQDDPAHTKWPVPNVVAQGDPAQSAPPSAAESLQDGRIASARRHDRQLILLH
jgi:hypothetical protein